MNTETKPVTIVCSTRQITLHEQSPDGTALGIVSLNGQDVETVELGEQQAKSIACWLARRYGFGIETSAETIRQVRYSAVPIKTPLGTESA